ncbi:MAG: MarR family transcriptional regulator [Thermaerobacter sp.]|nr:MarR family transcriptional regulator [Thermaerobacter sp.]
MERELVRFIEHFGLDFEQYGSQRTLGRLFAALLVSEKPLSLQDLATQLSVSKATCSLTVRQAAQAGLVEKVTKPGERKDYYVVPQDVWIRSTVVQLQILTRWQHLAEEGLRVLPADSMSFQRLTDMLRFFRYLDRKLARIADELGEPGASPVKEGWHDPDDPSW